MPRHPSEIEKTPDVSSVPAEKAPDFAELQRQKEELFGGIEEKSLGLDMDTKRIITRLVSGFSIKDGFEMVKLLGVDGFTYFLELATDHNTHYKNKTFYNGFGKFLNKNKRFIPDQVGRDFVDNFLKEDDFKNLTGMEDTHPSDFYQAGGYPYPPKDILKKVEDYYSHFIRNRRVKSPELPPNELTKVEMTAEDHLRSNEAMLEESYYTGPVREALGLPTETELELAGNVEWPGGFEDLTEDQVWKLRGNTIDKKTIIEIFETRNQMATDEDTNTFLESIKKTRYAPSVLLFNERKRGAEKGLVEQIKQSLIKRGFKEDEFEIKQNEKGEYEVVKKDEENEKQEDLPSEASAKEGKMERSKEGLNLVEDVPKKVEYRDTTYFLDSVDILDSDHGAHKIYHSKDNMSLIIDQFGNALHFPERVHNLQKVGEHEIFLLSKSEIEGPVYVVDGQELRHGNYQGYGNKPIELDNLIYWCGCKRVDRPGEWHNFDQAVFRGTEMLKDIGETRTFEGDLRVIGGELTYITRSDSEKVNHPKDKKIVFGSEEFGPYDDIKLCENSKDKLVFYARKGDEHFVYVDGVETDISKFKMNDSERFTDLIVESGHIVLVSKTNNRRVRIQNPVISDGDVYSVMECNGDVSNMSTIKDKFFCIINEDSEIPIIYWDHRQIPCGFRSNGRHKVVGFGNFVFISDNDRVIYLEHGSNNLKQLEFAGDIELVNSSGKLFIIESLADKKRVWEYNEKGELKLNEREQRDLDLANAVAKEDLSTITDYFNNYYPAEYWKSRTGIIKEGLKSMYEQSKSFVGAVNQTIKEAPELFMDTFRAKDDKPTEFLMTQMFYYMFPEAQAKREQALREEKRKGLFGGFGGGFGGGGRSEKDSTSNYDQGVEGLASVDESGYYEMVKANREVLKLREPLPPSTFITSGIFGNHTYSGWTRVNVPLDQEVQDPAKETTFEFVDEKASQTINLPRIAGAKIITERLKGITGKGKEVPVKIIEENNQGEVRVDKGKEANHITYSQSFSEAPKTMAEVTQRDYEKFKKDFERSFGDVMTKPIGDIVDELDIFVRGLKDKSPREQVIAIQEFCYEYGYYNLDKEPRDTNSFEERLSIMEGRMDELKEKDPKLARKLYAGICTDFATLTTALLRKAGFISGISTGFVPEVGSTSIKTTQAHAVSYVLWPSSKAVNGKPDMIIVDGTPSSITPKIVEQEKKAQEIHKELGGEAEKELAQLEHILKTMDVEAIKKLENGALEKTLNNILYGVKQSHVDVMGRLLNASRYAGFDILEMTRGSLEDQIEFRKFLEEEIHKEKSASHENRERRGEELFNMMLEFARRFSKDKNVHGKDEALDVLDKIFDMSRRYLDPVEERSAAAVITYLRARKMR